MPNLSPYSYSREYARLFASPANNAEQLCHVMYVTGGGDDRDATRTYRACL